ncbi:hypothetical protein V2J09_009946 [Rumex salicifolius]
MREIKLPLNQTQKLRFQRALDKLDSLSAKSNSNTVVAVGDSIPVNLEDAILKGHGTVELDGQLVATTCGVIERVNKLVYVRSLRSRYKPETGDIVVGRVIEVSQKSWRIEINSNQDAVLMLSSINMPDGIQRRRTALDELNMRNIFVENDVICGEVRNLQHDGTIQLQARSEKYGKLESGQLLKVPAYLIRRRKHHFYNLEEYLVTLVIGCNGLIWVGESIEAKDNMMEEDEDSSPAADSLSHEESAQTPLKTREIICRIANAIRVLSKLGFSVTKDVIMNLVDLSMDRSIDVHDMLAPEFFVLAAEAEAERRQKNRKI